jgi:rhamnulokinase
MVPAEHFAAVDLGASSGRVMLGRWDGARIALEERHRFANGPVAVGGHRYWDALRLWDEIKTGLARSAERADGRILGVGVDSWGVDFALLDRDGRLVGNPYHYRDRRTDGVPELVYQRVSRADLYAETGIQPMQINTLFQLFAMVRAGDPQLKIAATLLPMPNLFSHWLGGEQAAEYTHATTTGCLSARTRRWATGLLGSLKIPPSLFPAIAEPGTVLGAMRSDVAAEVGVSGTTSVFAVGCHDTASAVAAIPELGPRGAYISSGTWSLMGVEAEQPIITDRSREAGFSNEGGVAGTTRVLKVIAGLWLIQECQRRWRHDGLDATWDELIAMAEAAPPFGPLIDPDSPAFLSPDDMPSAIRDACRDSGQRPPESVGAIVRCCLESLVVRYRATLEELEGAVGHGLDTIHIVGGGSRNHLLCQLTADACGRPVIAGPVEAAALGNIMVQAIAAGVLSGIADGRAAVAASVTRVTYEPRPTDAWDAGVARLRALTKTAAES